MTRSIPFSRFLGAATLCLVLSACGGDSGSVTNPPPGNTPPPTPGPSATPVASVDITAGPDTLEAWDVRQLTATLKDANGRVLSGREVRWQVSDTTIAGITAGGILTGLDRGTVTLSAT